MTCSWSVLWSYSVHGPWQGDWTKQAFSMICSEFQIVIGIRYPNYSRVMQDSHKLWLQKDWRSTHESLIGKPKMEAIDAIENQKIETSSKLEIITSKSTMLVQFFFPQLYRAVFLFLPVHWFVDIEEGLRFSIFPWTNEQHQALCREQHTLGLGEKGWCDVKALREIKYRLIFLSCLRPCFFPQIRANLLFFIQGCCKVLSFLSPISVVLIQD